jgi:hypothetical protein
MPFNQQNTGVPFPGDYPGRPEHQRWEELEARVQRDVIDLARRRYEPAVRHERLRLLGQRRQPGQPGAGPQERRAGRHADDVTQFDVLPKRVGFDTLLKRGELLITGQSYDGRRADDGEPRPGPTAKRYLDAIGMEASEVDCAELHGRVLRLIPRHGHHLDPQELADIAKVLRTRGFTASLSNITPTAPVTKGKGAPEPTDPPPPGPPEPDDGPGEPTRVAIIDTGIADPRAPGQRRTDGWLQGVSGDTDPLDEFPLPGGDGLLDLAAGHGTFVAGIVQQVAPRARVTVYRAVDSDGIASEVRVACEMIRAVKDGNQILNLSLGCHTLDDLPPIAIRAALQVIGEMERAEDERAEDEHAKGDRDGHDCRTECRNVLIVAAAGNFGDTRPCWPAAFRRVVSVAGLAADMLPSQWSSHGFWVTCSTIGQGLRSTYVAGEESPLVDPEPSTFGPNAWAVWSGTSFAAPQITGALARLHEQYDFPLREALGRLLAAGTPIPDFGQALNILPGI